MTVNNHIDVVDWHEFKDEWTAGTCMIGARVKQQKERT